MPIPLCLSVPAVPDPFALPLPGGVELEDVNVMRVLQPALTPLMPMFEIVDTIVALYNCVKAIPDALGPPPDPTVLAACLPELGKKLGKLLMLAPQVALPRLIERCLALAIEALRTVSSQLRHLQGQLHQIDAVQQRAKVLKDAGLMAVAACATANVAQEAANVGKSMASLERLLVLVNLFMGLIGGPQVPLASKLSGKPLDEAVPEIDRMIKLLEAAHGAVPGVFA
jgi:hypothetical protein